MKLQYDLFKIESEYDDLDKYNNNINTWYCKKNTDKLHNPYGPALISLVNDTFYYLNDKLHRLDGPAVIWSNGNEYYYINGYSLTKEEFEYHSERLKFLNKEHLICLK